MISSENAVHYEWGRGCDGWHLVNTPELSVIQERMPPGTCEELHFHNRSRQFFFILAGIVNMEFGDKHEILRARQGLEIPPGLPHRISNLSDREAEFIVISHPHSHGDRVVATPPDV
ncbi:MAG TPA: cupin domain-containing protein [Bacteroidota bacterium]